MSVLNKNSNLNLVLASSSPSRKMLLDKLQIPYETYTPDIDESVLPEETPEHHVLRLSKNKALKIAEQLNSNNHKNNNKNYLIIGCDSVCVLNHQIMSKPENHLDAVSQLRASSGKIIYFYSGLSLYNTHTQRLQQEVVTTEVHFKKLSEVLIQAYLKKDQPYHCAGSVKAEGLGIILFNKIVSDDPNSLIGLPLIALIKMLENESAYPLLD